MQNSLLKIIDTSIFPIALLICAKVLGLILVNSLMGLDWSFVTTESSIYSVRIAYPTAEQKLDAASYSNFFMYIIVFIGFGLSLIQAYFLHDSHVSPFVVSKLISLKLVSFIKNSFEIFHLSFVWLILIWISTVLILLSALSGDTYIWIALLTTFLTITLTLVLAKDFNREIQLAKDL